jgi:hypothetical protein
VNKEASEPSNDTASRKTGSDKLPYQKPSFRYEGVFETMALACGKINPNQLQCRSLVKLS